MATFIFKRRLEEANDLGEVLGLERVGEKRITYRSWRHLWRQNVRFVPVYHSRKVRILLTTTTQGGAEFACVVVDQDEQP